jgi:hypothetical protein
MGIGFDFPSDQGSANGANVFGAWGTYTAPVQGIQGISATWTLGGTQVSGQVYCSLTANGIWAVVITGNLPAGTWVTLTVTGLSPPPPPPAPPIPVQVPETITFKVLGPVPMTFVPCGTTGS